MGTLPHHLSTDTPLDLNDLRSFLVVAEELHFGRAAVRMHLSQPGLSYRVRRLEEALGYELLTRTRSRVGLTPAGEVMLAGARRLLGDADRLAVDGLRVARGEIATVRLAVVGTALYSVVPALLRRAALRHPDLRVVVEELKSTAQVLALQSGRLDLGIAHLPLPEGSGLAEEVILEDPVGVAMPEDHPLAGGAELRLEQFAHDAFVLFPRELEPHTYDAYVAACVASGFAPVVGHQATGLPTILALVAAGAGVAFVAESLQTHSQRSGVVMRPLSGVRPVLSTGFAWRPDATPAARLLREVVDRAPGADRNGASRPLELLLD